MQDQGAIRRNKNGQRLSRFVFTLNNFTVGELAALKAITNVKWLIFGVEHGDEMGTTHLQGACVIGRQVAFSTLKKWKGLERAHIEPMHGSPADSLAYCTKEDKDAYQYGEMPAEGKRNDLHETIKSLKEGKSIRDIVNSEDISSIATIVRYPKGLNAVANLLRLRGREPPKVFWIHGTTGVGKTRCAFEFGNSYAGEDGTWLSSGTLRWFDGYDGQPVAVFDDLRTKHVEFSMLLRLLDRYPLRVEIKGGYVQWVPEVIIVTAPMSPDMMWNLRRNEDINQLNRRITQCIELTEANYAETVESLCVYLPTKDERVCAQLADATTEEFLELLSDEDAEPIDVERTIEFLDQEEDEELSLEELKFKSAKELLDKTLEYDSSFSDLGDESDEFV